jgi:drug/metabolite transporter (DMT)-like permease
MTIAVFAMVLAAAVFHAGWNALVKINADKFAVISVIKVTQIALALALFPVVGFLSPGAWPYLLASTAIHTGYYYFLRLSYNYGDLSYVYPVSRGTSPLLVALGSVVLIGETLTTQATLSLTIIAVGIMSLSLTHKRNGMADAKALHFAFATGLCTAGYTLMDGIGARLASDALTYIVWLTFMNGLPSLLIALLQRRTLLLRQMRAVGRPGILGGFVATAAYGIVIWASTVAPIALVSAIRETSMVFAVLFGVSFLGERLDYIRQFAIALTLLGVVLMRVNA